MALPTGYVFPDLNAFKRVTDWRSFARAYPVAFCKVSEGASFPTRAEDDYWPRFLAGCRANGIFPVGYHFLRREASLPDQVNNYLRRLDGGPVGICLDIETSHVKTNPSITQASQWMSAVAARTGRPRTEMISYLPRWWYEEHGGNSHELADTIWWLSHYSMRPDLSPMAGWDAPKILQYSDAVPGVGTPPCDMNIAINMTAAQLRAMLTDTEEGTDMALDKATQDYFKGEFDDIRDRVWDVRYKREGDVGHQDTNLETVLARIADLEGKVDFTLGAIGARFDSLQGATAAITAALRGALVDAVGGGHDLTDDEVTQIAEGVAARLYTGPAKP